MKQVLDAPGHARGVDESAVGFGLVGQPEFLSYVRPEQHGKVEPAMSDVEVGWPGGRHRPVDDSGQTASQPEKVEMLEVAVGETGFRLPAVLAQHAAHGAPRTGVCCRSRNGKFRAVDPALEGGRGYWRMVDRSSCACDLP